MIVIGNAKVLYQVTPFLFFRIIFGTTYSTFISRLKLWYKVPYQTLDQRSWTSLPLLSTQLRERPIKMKKMRREMSIKSKILHWAFWMKSQLLRDIGTVLLDTQTFLRLQLLQKILCLKSSVTRRTENPKTSELEWNSRIFDQKADQNVALNTWLKTRHFVLTWSRYKNYL